MRALLESVEFRELLLLMALSAPPPLLRLWYPLRQVERIFERIGIRFATVKSGVYKDILSPDRPLNAEERALLQELIDSSYGQFVRVVAEGRSMTEEAVRGFADGRVFSGEQAKALGLVDELGDEEHARCLAARLAALEKEAPGEGKEAGEQEQEEEEDDDADEEPVSRRCFTACWRVSCSC